MTEVAWEAEMSCKEQTLLHMESRAGELIILGLGKDSSSVECVCELGASFEFVLMGCWKKARWQKSNKQMMLQFVQ